MASCLRRTRTAIAVCKAIISRTLFGLHGFICIWRVTVVKGEPLYWCLCGTLPLMILETVCTIKLKKGGEWKWLCPSVLLYLCTTVPAIWFLELDLMKTRMAPPLAHQLAMANTNLTESDAISGLRISISLGREEWCKILEQLLLLILIIGRWLLPKGEITREQLSQLLLVYIGMAADIIELFEAFKEEGVKENFLLTIIILALWTASLTQFTFVLTSTKSKRMRPVLFQSASTTSAISTNGKSCCPTEVWSIVISMVLQDGPFLVLRMLLIFRYDVISYTNLFFTSKNSLVLMLQFYRLVVLFSQKKKEDSRAKSQQSETAGSSFGDSTGDLGRGPRFKSRKFPRNDEDGTSDECDDVRRNRGEVRSPTSARRESFKRQQHRAAVDYSTENEGSRGTQGSPSSQSDGDANATKRLKAKPGRRKVSEDSTRGSMGDSVEDVRSKGRGARGGAGEGGGGGGGRGGGGGGGEGKKEGVRRQRSAKDNWKGVQNLAKAIAFVNEAGTYKTLVLKPVDTRNNQTVFVVESEHEGRIMKGL
ncbi:transmembrane protein 26-like [Littorina saxatilis]|uniref:transmembrane protein 26-like n=1 Tax=Littorina saxatilis TaxID=31220 RepID=UPI0038B5F7AF